jgi:hypothetical protein
VPLFALRRSRIAAGKLQRFAETQNPVGEPVNESAVIGHAKPERVRHNVQSAARTPYVNKEDRADPRRVWNIKQISHKIVLYNSIFNSLTTRVFVLFLGGSHEPVRNEVTRTLNT